MLSRFGQRPAGRPRTECPPCPSPSRLRRARRPRPAGPLQSKKGPGAFQFPVAAGRAASRARACPAHSFACRPPSWTPRYPPGEARPPHLHSACPPHLHIALGRLECHSSAVGGTHRLTDFRPCTRGRWTSD
nr:TANK-binding kinase 1-binding protein 1 isoform X1 [Oryctolagus cuniculus]